jgi:hypothetical protein
VQRRGDARGGQARAGARGARHVTSSPAGRAYEWLLCAPLPPCAPHAQPRRRAQGVLGFAADAPGANCGSGSAGGPPGVRPPQPPPRTPRSGAGPTRAAPLASTAPPARRCQQPATRAEPPGKRFSAAQIEPF